MQISQSGVLSEHTDPQLMQAHLALSQGHLLELGCGAAEATRGIAQRHPELRITATEVDRVQHEKNLLIDDLPNVSFRYGGAEAIDLPDASVDAVIMLKSLHHVPPDLMGPAFAEIHRVLKPGGLAYISEPVYAGAFNDILRLFNDEQQVRELAFDAVKNAVDSGRFELVEEIHFNSPRRFHGFEEFEQRIMGVTHSDFDIDDALHEHVRQAFLPHVGEDGYAMFDNPLRIDLLRRI